MTLKLCYIHTFLYRHPTYLECLLIQIISMWVLILIRSYSGQGCGSRPFSAGSDKSEFKKPDPDPAYTHQDSIQTSTVPTFFSYQSDFRRSFYVLCFIPEKMEIFSWKSEKAKKKKNCRYLYWLIQLYIARVGSGSGKKFPDPAKKVQIRPDPDPQPCL